MSTGTNYTLTVLRHMHRTGARMTVTQIEAQFGTPGGPGRIEDRVKAWCAHGYLRMVPGGAEGCYAATGSMPDDPAKPVPTWAAVGRNAPRVASVFDLARGVVR